MDLYKGRVALVTGASAGIGAAICEALVKHGMKVVGAARRLEKIQELATSLSGEKGTLVPYKCDITADKEVQGLFQFIKEKYGGLDVCINNAGVASKKGLLDDEPGNWRSILDLNVVALCFCSKLAFKSMQEKGADDGYIININSMSGHRTLPVSEMHFYQASKFAVTALTQGLRQEIKERKSNIRVSQLCPGLVATDMIAGVDANTRRGKLFADVKPMAAEDMAAIVVHMLTSPPRVEIGPPPADYQDPEELRALERQILNAII